MVFHIIADESAFDEGARNDAYQLYEWWHQLKKLQISEFAN